MIFRYIVLAGLISLCSCNSKQIIADVSNPNIPVIDCIASLNASELELQIIDRINQLRTNPRSFIPLIKAEYATMNADGVYRRGNELIKTEEGMSAAKEAIKYLKKIKAVGALKRSGCLSLSAQDHVFEQGPKGLFGHASLDGSNPNERAQRYSITQVYCGENIAYGLKDALGIVIQLVIDDGVPDRGHRKNLFSPKYKSIGVANGMHSVYQSMSSHTMCINPTA